MEEVGEIGLCYNEYNKDHLATVENSSKRREENKQTWLVCGFNGFGQLQFSNKRKLLMLEEIQFDKSEVLVACSWNCLAIASGCYLQLQGFISNRPKAIESLHTQVPIKALEICDKFCLVQTENGKVYKLVPGSKELSEIKFQINIRTPRKRTTFGENKVVNLEIAHIACGENIVIAVSTENAVFSGTTQIYQFPKHQCTKQLKCGFEHVLLLTSNGDIYAWGNGLRGQLGLDVLRIEEIPILIEALAGIKITDIAAGGWHSAAISAFGDVYTWGFNSNGQVGLRLYKTAAETLKEPSVYPLPQLIDLPTCQCGNNTNQSCYPIKIAAGGRHTILQMNCGSVNACGWNAYGQLSLKNCREYCDNFEFVLKVEHGNISEKQIVCGTWCTLLQK